MLPNGQHAALEVAALATPLLVPMIEEGFFEDNISHAIIHNYLSHPSLAGIEGLLLACTHYPLIRTEIATYYAERGEAVHIFDPNLACADRVASILAERGWLNDAVDASVSPTHRFFVSDLTPSFAQTTRLFYPSAQVVLEKADIWV